MKFKKTILLNSILAASLIAGCAKKREYETVYKDPQIAGKSVINTSAEFLYVPTSLGVPRFTEGQAPFVQGGERIVKFKFTEEGIVAMEMEKEAQFQDNDLNNKPILTIPVAYKAFRCSENSNKECTNKEEENTEIEWDAKTHFIPDFEGMKVHEADSVGLPNNDSSCFVKSGTKLVDYEMTNEVLNVELENTYEYSKSPSCIERLFSSINTWRDFERFFEKNESFNSRQYYSFVRLDKIASPNYKAIDYPLKDHQVFGYFKTRNTSKNVDQNEEDRYLVNRWDTQNGTKPIVYHLSKEFIKEENKYLLDATKKAFDRMNFSLQKNGVKMRLQLEVPKDAKSAKNPGDLRNTMIVLVEDLASGLLGYGPSVANPKTGEIVKAHSNMYKGSLEMMAKNTYDGIVDLQQAQKIAAANQIDLEKRVNLGNEAANNKNLKDIQERMEKRRQKVTSVDVNMRRAIRAASRANLKEALFKNLKEKDLISSQLKSLGDDQQEAYKQYLKKKEINEYLHRNNVYTAEMFNFQALGKATVKEIENIPGVKDENGNYLPWHFLADNVKEAIIPKLVTHAYIPTLVHEIGHNLGLRHNFHGSYDRANFYSAQERQELGIEGGSVYSSIMDYSYSELNTLSTLGRYDIAALKYAYNREVELSNGQMISAQGKKVSELPLKRYMFCTEENVSSDTTCNRFDEGTNIVELTKHFVDRYDSLYSALNVRGRRKHLSSDNDIFYYFNKMNILGRLRTIHERWQGWHAYFYRGDNASPLAIQGCAGQFLDNYPFCNDLEEEKIANEIAGNKLMEVATTPDKTCHAQISAVVTETVGEGDDAKEVQHVIMGTETNDGSVLPTDEFISLGEYIGRIEFTLPHGQGRYVPTSCFAKDTYGNPANSVASTLREEHVAEKTAQACEDYFLSKEPEMNEEKLNALCQSMDVKFAVIGETGKFHSNVRAADRVDVQEDVNDLEIRGIWMDKLIAISHLTNNYLATMLGNNNFMSFMDIAPFRTQMDALMNHLANGAPLYRTNTFLTADKKMYKAQANLDLNIKTEVPMWMNDFVTKKRDSGIRALIEAYFTNSDNTIEKDFAQLALAQAGKVSKVSRSDLPASLMLNEEIGDFSKSIGAYVRSRTASSFDFGEAIVSTFKFDEFEIGATKRNTVALKMLDKINGELDAKIDLVADIKKRIEDLNTDEPSGSSDSVPTPSDDDQNDEQTDDEVVVDEDSTESEQTKNKDQTQQAPTLNFEGFLAELKAQRKNEAIYADVMDQINNAFVTARRASSSQSPATFLKLGYPAEIAPVLAQIADPQQKFRYCLQFKYRDVIASVGEEAFQNGLNTLVAKENLEGIKAGQEVDTSEGDNLSLVLAAMSKEEREHMLDITAGEFSYGDLSKENKEAAKKAETLNLLNMY
ncbi:MAG: hypothetical protein GY909_12980 [Oligoflexia bacterium]|nr:hypothetical protein [Oligoflexia bacterium]